MKTLLRWGCLVATVAIVVVVGRSWAESKAKRPAPRTRIGTFNLAYVVKNYDKYKQFQKEIMEVVEPYRKHEAKLRARLEKLHPQAALEGKQHATRTPASPPSIALPDYLETPESKNKTAKRPAAKPDKAEEESEEDEDAPQDVESEVRDIQRKLADMAAEVKLKLDKRSDDAIRTIYMDVYAAVNRYAADRGLDLVMHYNDATTKEDYMGAKNIARKLNSGSLIPMYEGKGIDISKDIAEALNDRFSKDDSKNQ